MTRWSLFLQTLSLLHHFLGLYCAPQTQVGWLYLFDAMIWSVLAVSLILPWWSLKPLRIDRHVFLPQGEEWHRDPVRPVEDTTVQVRLRVTNSGRFARHFVKILEHSPLDEPSKRPRSFLLARIKGKSEAELTYSSTCYRRGRYGSATAVLETSAPLGLIVRRRHFELPVNTIVYPAHYGMSGVPSAREIWSDAGQRLRSNAGAEFYGSRDYQRGDPLRHIHWRNTARRGEFMVKEFEDTSQGTVAVAFESAREWGEGKETTLEYSIRITASVARYCGESSRPMGVLAPPDPLVAAHWLEAMEYLAGLGVGETAGLDSLTESVRPGQTLVVVVPAAAHHLAPVVSRLGVTHASLLVVLLEGFAPEEEPDAFVSGLSGTGTNLIRCSKGSLKDAVDELGGALALSS